MTHEDRLALARDYGDAVLGIALSGSVARNTDTSKWTEVQKLAEADRWLI